MRARSFFRGSLVLPILLPLALLPFDANAVSVLLILSLGFGGIAYLVFAVLIFLRLGQLSTAESMERLLFKAPLLFIPIQAATWVLWFYIQKFSNPDLTGGWEALPAFGFYGLLIGYAYVAAVYLFYVLLIKVGVICEQMDAP